MTLIDLYYFLPVHTMSLQSDIAGIHPIPFEESRLKASLLSLDSVFGIYPNLAWIAHTKTSAPSSIGYNRKAEMCWFAF